ncbi:DUF2931 family protein [Cytophaga hutchinsonii]|uniref:DUF2931 family protein n=1 Tax=Cytophaga hutchinsonii (strain ATCC 33406 / DSM 1761 / CIP 103989 / NBRC 15051 / NCIMB 9469 / D465) TaxID=269798 RepID=A0A6N4SNR9_CYTH3|nr:DUF2931 family protein [Cytophaga hutchinsonii]ABG57951.1 conserved hypothetical protein [Cytophaga hutchinsonii ATCC 33406]SFX09854.1 Protein of unknown function [Cytophaga hutchinsonii ATCC 33406]
MKQTIILILLIIHNTLSSCQTKEIKNNMVNKKFDWSHSVSAPENYPMEIYRGKLQGLTDKDYSASFGLWGVANEGWGTESGMVAVGPDTKAIPDSLLITWLSFRENKFYTGKFQLPREKMTELFENGFYEYDIKQRSTYEDILVGLAPGGVVVVWLVGGQVQIEVARFQAQETIIDKSTVTNPDDLYVLGDGYVDFVLNNKEIATGPIPFGLWDTYREKYSWRPMLILPEGYELAIEWMTLFNGEKEKNFKEHPEFGTYKSRALPSYMLFNWYASNGRKYGVDVFFNEAEIFEAYKQIYRNDKEQDAELVFELNDAQTSFTISVRSKTEQIELHKVKAKIYKSEDTRPVKQ